MSAELRLAVLIACWLASGFDVCLAAEPIDVAPGGSGPSLQSPGGAAPGPAGWTETPRLAPALAAPADAAPSAGSAQPFAAGLGELGLRLLRAAAAHAGGDEANALVSPYSLANALGMLHAGAAGDTAAEIARVLAPAPIAAADLGATLGALNRALATQPPGVELVAANRVWIDKAAVGELNKPFSNRVAEQFHADGAALDFADPPAASATINQWISQATKGHIPRLLGPAALPATSKLVAINAVYFRGAWAQAFSPALTRELPFLLKPGHVVDVPTMTGTMAIREGAADGFDVFELPYGEGDFALVVALPAHAEQALSALDRNLSGAALMGWLPALKPATVTLQLPRFRIVPSATPLKDALIDAGMSTAFGPRADFEPMASHGNLVLDNVIHAAGIAVDEQGSVASAATAAVVRSKNIAAAPPLRRINRPFLFAIVHKPTATPLFVGRLYDPAR